MKTARILFLTIMTVLAGCARTKAPAKQHVAPLTAQQTQLNLASFDQVWLTVKEQHWDPTLNGVDWDAAKIKYRPQVERAKTMSESRDAMSEMIGELGQSHFAIIGKDVYREVDSTDDDSESPSSKPSKAEGATGLDVRVVEDRAVVTKVWPGTPAAEAGVKPGWIIEKVKTRNVGDVLKKVEAAYTDSSMKEAALHGAVMNGLDGDVGDEITITFLDADDKPVSKTLTLAPPPGTPAKFGHLPTFFVTFESKKLPPNVGYIAFSAFFDPAMVMSKFGEAMEQFHDADGIIIDLRGNPGGLGAMAMGVGGFFVTESGQKLGTMTMRQASLNFVLNPRPRPFEGPLAILVDGNSMSTSEILAGGLQDLNRARVFGTASPGLALPSIVERLPNGDGFQYAMANYVSAGGQPLEARGVKPDEVVELDRAALLAGRDPVIEAAVKWIESQKHQ
jgi:carboxyl-terminal processing protease